MKAFAVLFVATGLVSALSIPQPLAARGADLVLRQEDTTPTTTESEAPAATTTEVATPSAEADEGDENDEEQEEEEEDDDRVVDDAVHGNSGASEDRQRRALSNAIRNLVGVMGLGRFFDTNRLRGLGVGQEIQLFLQLQQLAQLQSFGFINQVQIAAFLQRGNLGANFGGQGIFSF